MAHAVEYPVHMVDPLRGVNWGLESNLLYIFPYGLPSKLPPSNDRMDWQLDSVEIHLYIDTFCSLPCVIVSWKRSMANWHEISSYHHDILYHAISFPYTAEGSITRSRCLDNNIVNKVFPSMCPKWNNSPRNSWGGGAYLPYIQNAVYK